MIQELSFPPRIKYGVNSSGNPDRKHWIPDQARNDKMYIAFSETGRWYFYETCSSAYCLVDNVQDIVHRNNGHDIVQSQF
jgi:hypothetical protein